MSGASPFDKFNDEKLRRTADLPRGVCVYFLSPKISSDETSSIMQRFANVSISGNLSACRYLLIVEGCTPSRLAISDLLRALVSIASQSLLCISLKVITVILFVHCTNNYLTFDVCPNNI